jgi:hypothetical protein
VKRRYLSAKEKALVIERQKWKCACGCGETLVLGKIDFDHTLALQFGGTNDISNFCALIVKHHKQKSNKENTLRAKADRLKLKAEGRWLNAKDRELAKIFDRTKYLHRP